MPRSRSSERRAASTTDSSPCFIPMLPVWTTVNASRVQPSRVRAAAVETSTGVMCVKFGSPEMDASGRPCWMSRSPKRGVMTPMRSARRRSAYSPDAMRRDARPPVVPDSPAALPVRSWTSTPNGRRPRPSAPAARPASDGVTAMTTSLVSLRTSRSARAGSWPRAWPGPRGPASPGWCGGRG
ncbi:hypothetical protein BC477_14465 [Clavibacter michiganensis subsp. michiganensis]|nr:hypothetical protein BC477_14465 [Clavibacter michiganensis subsp. michiganensis]